jgi:hypothetical protein
MFSVAIANLVYGFAAGVAACTLMNTARYERMQRAMQKTVDLMFEKDETIDELSAKLETLQAQYDELYEATETSRRAFDSVRHLAPPNSPFVRAENYEDECDCNFHPPNLTSELDSMD